MGLYFEFTAGEEYTRTTNLPAGVLNLSVMVLLRTRRNTTNHTAWSLSLDSSNHLSLQTGGGNTNVFFQARVAATNGSATLTNFLSADEWWLLAGTRDAGTVTIYGAPVRQPLKIRTTVNTGAPSGDFVPTTLTIGDNAAAGTTEFRGDIAQCKMWTATLTRAQVEQEFVRWREPGARSDSLHAVYLLGGDATRDSGPNGYHLTAGTARQSPGPMWAPLKPRYGKAAAAGGDAVPQVWMQYRARRVA